MACGAGALALATALLPVPGIGLTIVAASGYEKPPSATPEENARQLARLAERIF